MTKKDMFNALLSGNKPVGRVLFRPILMQFGAQLAGSNYGGFASDYRILVKANLMALEKFDIDMAGLISDPYRETSAFGAPLRFIPDGVPVCERIIVRSIDDARSLKNPDVHASERTSDRLKAASQLSKELKGEIPIIGWVEGPLAEACDLAGVGEMLMYLMTDPGFCELLMDKCLVTAKSFAQAQIEAGCDIIGIGDAICSQIDPQTYETFVMERHRELISFIHDQGAKVKLHICGNITHLLPYLSKVGADILDLDWQVDITGARRIMGNTTILCGNINPVTIQDESPENLYSIARNLVMKYSGERFILSGGCEITVNTSHSNLSELRKASYI